MITYILIGAGCFALGAMLMSWCAAAGQADRSLEREAAWLKNYDVQSDRIIYLKPKASAYLKPRKR